jgi:tRNA(Ile)-lysidine synthase
LAWWLHDFATRPNPPFTFVGLIHVNHKLRGAASDADASFCRQLADRLAVPIEVIEAPVVARGRSPEADARRVRYAAIEQAADRLGATVVCTAHTADDQAETVLLRLFRGAGLRGLSGIRVRHSRIVRPLLECRRSELRAALTAKGESWREDASNADVSIPRNRLRHELLPHIERLAAADAPGAIAALARFSAFAVDDETFLEDAAIELAGRIVSVSAPDGCVSVERVPLATAPAALARRVIRGAAERVAPDRPWSAVHIEAVRRLAQRQAGRGHLDLPGVSVARVGQQLRFCRADTREGTIGPGNASD